MEEIRECCKYYEVRYGSVMSYKKESTSVQLKKQSHIAEI